MTYGVFTYGEATYGQFTAFTFTVSPPAATGVFSEKAIHASLLRHFLENYSETADVEYDEEPFDTEGKTEWVQVDGHIFDSDPRRKTGKETQQIRVTCHIWVKQGTNIYRASEVADSVLVIYDHAYIPVRDYDTTGEPIVGGINMREARITDRSREEQDPIRQDWQHLVVTIAGRAEES